MLSSKSMKNGLLRILNDLDSAGRGGRRDEEEGGMRRKEGRGGRREEESEKLKKIVKITKNEKVAKGRIIGLVYPLTAKCVRCKINVYITCPCLRVFL